jgi:hypothetical protein
MAKQETKLNAKSDSEMSVDMESSPSETIPIADASSPKFLECADDPEFSLRDKCLLNCCITWFNSDESRTTQLHDILSKRSGVSLRLVDWLVTNASKTSTIVVYNKGIPVDAFVDYRRRLSSHTKRNFDAFARRKRITLTFFGNIRRQSSLAQLNFFKYIIDRNLFEYCKSHRDEIEAHMKQVETARKQTVGRTIEPHRMAVVKAAPQIFSGKFNMEF